MYGPVEDPSLRRLVCHCLLIETPRSGPVLVDTGFGLGDGYRARQRLSRLFMFTNRIQLDDEQTALRQVEKLGYGALEVRHIVLTHLDFDHAVATPGHVAPRSPRPASRRHVDISWSSPSLLTCSLL